MDIKTIDHREGPNPDAYPPAVVANGFVFVSGQVGRDDSGTLKEGLEAQINQAMKNIETILEAAGSSLDRVVRIGAFLANVEDFPRFNKTYLEFYPDYRPARTAVEGGRFSNPEMLVEIEAIAVVD